MNIGIIGSGGREHSLCYKLKESSLIDQIFCFPGNAGTELIAENINLDVSDFEKIHKICEEKKIELNEPNRVICVNRTRHEKVWQESDP